MDLSKEKALNNALIVSITPYFIEKANFWFTENLAHVLKARKTQSFWQDNTLFLEKDQKINISEVLKNLDEMGYEKVFKITAPGEFSQMGGIIEVFPINSAFAVRLDFLGNKIETIEKLPLEIANEEISKALLKKKLKSQKIFSDLKGLKPGDYLVHLDHGIGQFYGIGNFQFPVSNFQSISNEKISKQRKQYYILKYASEDKLYVPVGLERKLTRYIGFVEPKLSRLSSVLWQKTKYKIKEEAEKFARELLAMFSQKEIAKRPAYSKKELAETLEATFPYSLTPDQSQCLKEIEKDFAKEKPADRIICGDVGFGKTEVALRACVLAAENNKQAVLMCPTTVLASQHYNTFQKRLAGLPLKVALLSRLQDQKKKPCILKELKDGAIDILIATHSVLSKNIEFKNLGLLIIDDEQRFGVKQKEKLRQQNPALDILYLSATPIPRTLYMALSSLKEISFIQTPPQGRKPIKTFVLPFKKEFTKKAIEAELKRNGQIYFLHNRVETINAFKAFLQNLKTEARIGILHAKLTDREIVKVLNEFQQGKINLLLATTIIENGLDISNANTLIVDNATRLGLAQAYQLRGRIGRSSKQSFAYFLYPKGALKGLAKQRLNALKQAEELGSGYRIAQADLEIRGAGNILGREQSGAVNRIGLNLYCQMLSEAVEKLKTTVLL
ncbi:MAG: CarD family transcriptional regulator [Candidatus Pacebacteria bacterium]|nr:CarD family transcriptional regulator [Candidatus Paceibacterota bacterium]